MKHSMGSFQVCTAATFAQLAAAQSLQVKLSKASRVGGLELTGESQALLEAIAVNPSAMHMAVASLNERVKVAYSREALTVEQLPTSRLILLDRLSVLLESLHQSLVQWESLAHGKARALPLAFHIDSVALYTMVCERFLPYCGSVVLHCYRLVVRSWFRDDRECDVLTVCHPGGPRGGRYRLHVGRGLRGRRCGAVQFRAAACCIRLCHAGGHYRRIHVCRRTGNASSTYRCAGGQFRDYFLESVPPQNTSQMFDAAGFFNGVLILLLGIACGTLIFALIFPSNLLATRYRLHRAVRRDFRRIGRHPNRWSFRGWQTRTADRLGRQLATANGDIDTQAERELRGLLGAWTIGYATIALHYLAEDFHPVRRPVVVILGRLTNADSLHLATAARSSARSFTWQSRGANERKRQDLLRAAILSLSITEAATEHEDFLGE
mgnify:CR=1 FL=1